MDHSWRKIPFLDSAHTGSLARTWFFLSAAFLGPYIGFLSLLPVIIAAPFLLALMFDLTPREAALAAGALTIYKMLLSTAFVFIFGAGR